MHSNANSTLHETVEARLGRALEETEREMLDRLSPHGLAKINRDAIREISMEQTLKDLSTVFEKSQMRRQLLQTQVADPRALLMLAKLGRAPTADEFALFSAMPQEWLEDAIKNLTSVSDDNYAEVIEDIAMQFKFQQLQSDAQQLADSYKVPVSIIHLTSTLCPPTVSGNSRNIAKVGARKIVVGLSPVMTWFQDHPKEIHIDEKAGTQSELGCRLPSPPQSGKKPSLKIIATPSQVLVPLCPSAKGRAVRFSLPEEALANKNASADGEAVASEPKSESPNVSPKNGERVVPSKGLLPPVHQTSPTHRSLRFRLPSKHHGGKTNHA